jgi:hypothetical protein
MTFSFSEYQIQQNWRETMKKIEEEEDVDEGNGGNGNLQRNNCK